MDVPPKGRTDAELFEPAHGDVASCRGQLPNVCTVGAAPLPSLPWRGGGAEKSELVAIIHLQAGVVPIMPHLSSRVAGQPARFDVPGDRFDVPARLGGSEPNLGASKCPL